ncbi:MAG: hypothetical protein ACREKE_01465, partial [bacterium]
MRRAAKAPDPLRRVFLATFLVLAAGLATACAGLRRPGQPAPAPRASAPFPAEHEISFQNSPKPLAVKGQPSPKDE